MKDKVLSIISLITVFVPFTVAFVWDATSPDATAIIIGYFIFIAFSFLYDLFLFAKLQLRNNYTNISLGVNTFYLLGILVTVVVPRLL